ncbi:hypothetical protein [Bradyrhizobium sp. SZCCHNRI3052]|uniref:hypothetical protein n=1 Tax=Bradyrhizobium sp. SZCCHNRI3052 TaxID=3057295 RepID=UPI002916C523|nr:hypothetical protein [Bradyrhizobium sp. SZCCHNRI3052]
MVRAIHAMERRLQDLERKFQNKERLGKIVAVKFEKNRWYVKMNDGEDQTPSGNETYSKQDTFKSDWQPWQSHSHATIKYSVPPKIGMHGILRSVGGIPELGTVEPFHYGPDTPSPHGKQDETVGLIHEKEDQQHWIHQTKDSNHLIIKTKKKQQGAPTGLGDISGLGDLAGISQMAGLSGTDFSSMLGGLSNLGNLGNLASLDISNIANMAGLSQLSGLKLGQLANVGQLANLSGLPGLSQLGNLAGIANQVASGNLMGVVGQMIGGGAGGAAGIPASLAGGSGGGGGGGGGSGSGSSDTSSSDASSSDQQQQSQQTQPPKLPEVPEEGDDGVTRQLADKEKILKTVGKNKSYYRQDEKLVNVRYGEKGAKGDVLMDENQVKIQFKDKKASVKWTENDLNVTYGENQANIKLDQDAIVLKHGDGTTVTFHKDHVEVKGANSCSAGVDGRWVNITKERVNLGVSGPNEQADQRVMTEAGPSQVVWAKIA